MQMMTMIKNTSLSSFAMSLNPYPLTWLFHKFHAEIIMQPSYQGMASCSHLEETSKDSLELATKAWSSPQLLSWLTLFKERMAHRSCRYHAEATKQRSSWIMENYTHGEMAIMEQQASELLKTPSLLHWSNLPRHLDLSLSLFKFLAGRDIP